jgi:hypothetical protein
MRVHVVISVKVMPYTYQKNANGEFVCPICQITKARQNTMHYHMKKHEGHLPFVCEFCNKEFLHSQTLAIHISARHAKEEAAKFSCPCCDYKTLTKGTLVIHYVRNHCETEISEMKNCGNTCSVCQKVANSKTALLYHIAKGCLCLSDEKKEMLHDITT